MPRSPAASLCMNHGNGSRSVSLSIWIGGSPTKCGGNVVYLETNQFRYGTLKPDAPELKKLFDLTLR